MIRTIRDLGRGIKFASIADLITHFRHEQNSWRQVAHEAEQGSTKQTIAKSRARGYEEVIDSLISILD